MSSLRGANLSPKNQAMLATRLSPHKDPCQKFLILNQNNNEKEKDDAPTQKIHASRFGCFLEGCGTYHANLYYGK